MRRAILRASRLWHKNVLGIVLLYCTTVSTFTTAQTFRFLAEEVPPLIYVNGANELEGYLYDVTKQLINVAGISATVEIVPWARAYEMSLNEANVILITLLDIPQRKPLFHWIGKSHEAKGSVFRLGDYQHDLPKDFSALTSFQVGTVRGYGSAKFLTKQGFDVSKNLVLATNSDQLWGMLYERRIPFIVSNNQTARFEAAKAGYNPDHMTKVMDIPGLTSDLYFATGKKTAVDAVERLKSGLKIIQSNGELARTKRKWADVLAFD